MSVSYCTFLFSNIVLARDKLSFAKLIRDTTKLAQNIDPAAREQEIQNYIRVESKSQINTLFSKTKMFPSEQLLEIMAACHSLTFVKNSLIGIFCHMSFFFNLIGDPLDIKMFESTKWVLEENENQKFDPIVNAVVKTGKKEIGIIRRFEFASKLQRMSVILKDMQGTEFKMHMKGSPEKVRELCDPNSVPDNFHSVLQKYTEVSIK